jgi:hypothetical protein
MRRLLLLLLMVISGGCSPHGTPELYLSDQVFDFGFVPNDGKDFTIPIRNSGTAPLTIHRINKACECTLVAAPTHLESGKSGQLVIKPKRAPGPNFLRLLLETNDPARTHEILIKYFGESPPTLDPPRLWIEGAVAGTRVERIVKITYSGGDSQYTLKIKNIKVSNSAFKITHLKPDRRQSSNEVWLQSNRAVVAEELFQVACEAPGEGGSISGTCTLTVEQANHEQQLELPVVVNVRSPLQAYPDSLFLTPVTPGDEASARRALLLRVEASLAGRPRVVSHPDWIACSVLDTTHDRSGGSTYYRLQVTLKEGVDKLLMINGQIIVEVSGVNKGQIHIPVYLIGASG